MFFPFEFGVREMFAEMDKGSDAVKLRLCISETLGCCLYV